MRRVRRIAAETRQCSISLRALAPAPLRSTAVFWQLEHGILHRLQVQHIQRLNRDLWSATTRVCERVPLCSFVSVWFPRLGRAIAVKKKRTRRRQASATQRASWVFARAQAIIRRAERRFQATALKHYQRLEHDPNRGALCAVAATNLNLPYHTKRSQRAIVRACQTTVTDFQASRPQLRQEYSHPERRSGSRRS